MLSSEALRFRTLPLPALMGLGVSWLVAASLQTPPVIHMVCSLGVLL